MIKKDDDTKIYIPKEKKKLITNTTDNSPTKIYKIKKNSWINKKSVVKCFCKKTFWGGLWKLLLLQVAQEE